MTAPPVDRDMIARHVNVLFRHAGEGGFANIRAFYDDKLAKKRNDPPFKTKAVRLNGKGLEPVIEAAFTMAQEAAEANRPVVVCPPIATFRTGSKADVKGLLEGLVLSVEIDEHGPDAVAKLRAVLGDPTLVIESGGTWKDPATGEVQPKIHVHYRLNEPTQTTEEHERLKRARTLACKLVGADATSNSVVHPIRWAGTVHRKNPNAPKLATIIEENAESEISLDDALSELEGLEILRDEAAGEQGKNGSGEESTDSAEFFAEEIRRNAPGYDPTGDADLLMACAERIPNADLDWDAWNRILMAFWAASKGSAEGLAGAEVFSAKSGKTHGPSATRARWEHFSTSPPERLSVRTLVYEARKGDPAFRRGKPKSEGAATGTAPNNEAAADDHPDFGRWNEQLHRTERGEARDILHNATLILRTDGRFKDRIRYNEMLEAAECCGMPWRRFDSWREWSDADDLELANWAQQRHAYLRPATCAAAVQVVARDIMHHPVRERLDGLKWDGTPRLHSWLTDYLGVEASPDTTEGGHGYTTEVGMRWPISAVARVYQPGCKADHCLILEGPQGLGKSTAAAALAMEDAWFSDEIADIGTKDCGQDLRGKWIIELGELSALRRGEIERVKAFMSRKVDHYRPSYGRRSQDFPRQCVFIGSTNADAYLADETGGRRFWPVKIGKINLEKLKADREQLWAEAVAAYRAGEKWWLDKAIEAQAREQQEQRRIVDPWEERVLDYVDGRIPGLDTRCDEVTIARLLELAIEMPIERQGQADQNRVARILRPNGWKLVQRRVNGWRQRFYIRDVPDPTRDSVAGPVITRDGKPSNSAAVTGVTGVTGNSPPHTRPKATSYGNAAHAAHDSCADETFKTSGTTGDTRDTLPDWGSVDRWRNLYRAAGEGRAERIRVIADYAKAAGGSVEGPDEKLVLKLPVGLPSCLALNEMKVRAEGLGMKIERFNRPAFIALNDAAPQRAKGLF
jgi:predicted P-loop ATPase